MTKAPRGMEKASREYKLNIAKSRKSVIPMVV